VVGVLAIGTIGALTVSGGSRWPKHWEPEIQPLAQFVERSKGASFTHPVPLHYLDPDEFDDKVTSDDADLSEKERQDMQRAEGALRAVGLLEGDSSLLDQSNDLAAGGIAAFYDPDAEEIVLSATKPLDVMTRVTLVHELTHALQDQMGHLDYDAKSSDQDDAFHALVEGDATRVEYAYVDSLSTEDQDAYYRGSDDQGDQARKEVADVSPALTTMFSARYTLGYGVISAAEDQGGISAVTTRLDEPLASTADLMAPSRWEHSDPPIAVDAPEAPEGADHVEKPDTYGALATYLTLAPAVGIGDALDAAAAWGGDQMVTYTDAKGHECIRMAFAPVQPGQLDVLRDTWTRWAASRPSGTASANAGGGHVDVEACEPEHDGGASLTPALAAVPEARVSLFLELRQEGSDMTAAQAACVADGIVRTVDPEWWVDDDWDDARRDELFSRADELSTTCPR